MFVVFMMQSPSKRAQYRPLLRNMVYAAIVGMSIGGVSKMPHNERLP